jgi:hypothetical protein
MKILRPQDVVCVNLTVFRVDPNGDILLTNEHSSRCIRAKLEDVEIVRQIFKVGDRVTWHDGGIRWGKIIALDFDDNCGVGDGIHNAWIKEDGKWPRLTIDCRKLRRG